jgi:hypothetical protein
VEQAVKANAYAEKFICTGIRYYEQAMSVNITVRKRAKAACDYAKELNPELSTWYQTKPTTARSYAGKVLLTAKTAVFAGKWIQVASLDSDFERVVRFTGAGFKIDVKIYIDGKQVG